MVRIRSLLDILALLVSVVGVLPVWLYLDRPVQIAFPAALLIGAWCDRKGRSFLPPAAATVLSVLVFVVYALQISRQTLVEPALNLAVLLLAIRLLTEKEGRHFLQIFLLAGFTLAGSSLLTLSLAFLPLMVVQVTAVICGLVLLCFFSDDPRLCLDRAGFGRLWRVTLLLPAGALVLALLFFFILPRTQHPLWDFLNPDSVAKVGFSEEVSPGTYASTVADDSVAFRADGPEMDPTQLYWRVTVLDRLDGSTWKMSSSTTPGEPDVVGGKPVSVTIFPVAGQGKYLVTLDSPIAVRGVSIERNADGVFRYHRSNKRPQSYQVEAQLNGQLRMTGAIPESALQLPADVAERTRSTARQLVSDTPVNRRQKIEAVKAFFRQQQLVYATENLPRTNNPIDLFLFESKRGYCEYFSSAFAIMLREIGVPARLVGGYLGGSYNELGRYYIIGERTAHVWVEALSDDGTWMRIDPNLYAVNAEGALLARHTRQPLGWRQLVDAIDYYWTQVVITFDFSRQLGFLKSARDMTREWRRGDISWRSLAWFILLPAAAIIFLIVRRGRDRTAEEKLLQRFRQVVRRRSGNGRFPPNAGLAAMVSRAPGPLASEFARIYGAAIYGDRSLHRNEIVRLKQLLRQMDREE